MRCIRQENSRMYRINWHSIKNPAIYFNGCKPKFNSSSHLFSSTFTLTSALKHYQHDKVIVTIISDVLIHLGVEKTRLDYRKGKQLMRLKQF